VYGWKRRLPPDDPANPPPKEIDDQNAGNGKKLPRLKRWIGTFLNFLDIPFYLWRGGGIYRCPAQASYYLSGFRMSHVYVPARFCTV
jgi:hypothetical protein